MIVLQVQNVNIAPRRNRLSKIRPYLQIILFPEFASYTHECFENKYSLFMEVG
jgi:hypothetical protein